MTKQIAWGTSKLLEMFVTQAKQQPFAYCIDDFTELSVFAGMPVRKSSALAQEKAGEFRLVIFAVSSTSLQAIFEKLHGQGLQYGKDFILYSDFFFDSFKKKADQILGWTMDPRLYRYAISYTLNSRTPIHTTILGTWMILEVLKQTAGQGAPIAEVGTYRGGNALCCLNFLAALPPRTMYLFDSFEGFPQLSSFDPATMGKGDYKIDVPFEEILGKFTIFPEVKLIKGFIPGTFDQVPPQERFSMVFYDCDLYQPALDTFEFFWDRLLPGGFILIHDFETQKGGFRGVQKAVDEFFTPKKITFTPFFENTMAIVRK